MNRRLTAAGLAVLLVPAAAACDPATSSTSAQAATTATAAAHSSAAATASVSVSASPAPSGSAAYGCTGLYLDTNSTGVTLTHGKVTGSMSFTCANVPPSGKYAFFTTVSLFYRPNDHDATTDLPGASFNSYQDAYTTPADTCQVGKWYIGWAGDAGYGHGPELDITNCSASLS